MLNNQAKLQWTYCSIDVSELRYHPLLNTTSMTFTIQEIIILAIEQYSF
jgi:hypothetical protein